MVCRSPPTRLLPRPHLRPHLRPHPLPRPFPPRRRRRPLPRPPTRPRSPSPTPPRRLTRAPDAPSTGGDGGDSVSLPARLGAAAGTPTNLALLALGLGLALVAASPRGPTYRRARREVLERLSHAYDEQHRASEELAEADRLKGEFLSMVSHELRTPLTSVKGFVDTVLLHWEQFPDAQRRELLDRASGRADELTRLISQLLDFAAIDADRVDIDPRPLGVRDSVDAVLADLAPVLADHDVEVDVPAGPVMTGRRATGSRTCWSTCSPTR